ncbi:hypothetical protein T01_8923 [Trichinella spiralis]|uniref:Uncharacterized protein n=1 Tax=Trichinella spiralis TaxID=6334 RepID=A0A0V1BUH4_TRISP|nr:hypothetical protein T01_8923 [Trichinella spiralis]
MQTEFDTRRQWAQWENKQIKFNFLRRRKSVGQGTPKDDSISRHGNAARLDDAYGFSDSEKQGQHSADEI